jgi:hypothetical protein
MATSDNSGSTPPRGSGTAPSPPGRLLAASRVVHQLWRTQDNKIDLNRLLADEGFAKNLLRSARVYADLKTIAMIDDFERASIETGAWRGDSLQAKPSYQTNADGTISAAAAWDPAYVPPVNADNATFEAEYIPTTSPRTSITVKDLSGSGFSSRFGLSRPFGSGDAGSSVRNSPRSSLPASRPAGASTQNPESVPANGSLAPKDPNSPNSPNSPIDPKHKKYIRGAR